MERPSRIQPIVSHANVIDLEDRLIASEARVAELDRLLRRARPHVDAPLGTLAADIDLALNR